MNLILLGPPGAGKGTQAKAISDRCNVPHISTGDMFREIIKTGGDLAKQLKSYMDKGELVPDKLVLEVVEQVLTAGKGKQGFLLDGFPRTMPQADGLGKALSKSGRKIDGVFCFSVPDETVVERLSGRRTCRGCGVNFHVKYMPPKKDGVCDKCGKELYQRDDDKEATIRNRLAVYHSQTADLIEYYRKKGVLIEIEADKAPEKVAAEVDSRLDALMKG
ncbi:MAG TPA: adenylate kinase [Candidatus Brocadiia bacterium]|nr:adenylate kinase [Candidatus Brocadiia bacterium]